jgi:rRNA maturation RNase YbeY
MIEDNDTNFFKIDWSSRSKLRGPGERSLGELVLKLRNKLAPETEGISITYLDNRAMKKLNREHRNIDQPTDVLSFPAHPEKGAFNYLGDIVISLPVAEKISKKLGVSRRREVETLVIHGFLHLCRYNHETDNGEMMAMQAELEREFLGSEPLVMLVKRGRKPGSKVKRLQDG